MLRALVIVAAAIGISGCMNVLWTSQPGSDSELKIATWNIEHLAEANGTGCRPRTDQDYLTLRRYADQLDADVIAFQEVENEAAAARVFDPARYSIIMSQRPASARGGTCYDAPGQSIRQQAVGFAIRKGVPFSRHPDLSELAFGDPDLRWGVDITVGEQAPVRLLALHLKSGCNSGRSPTDDDCPVLFAQLPIVERWVEARARAGDTFAVLGDWNRRMSSRGDPFFADLNDGDPPGSTLTLAGNGKGARCKVRYSEFIDLIALSGKANRRVIPGSFEEFTYAVPEDRHPSDHCPISVSLEFP